MLLSPSAQCAAWVQVLKTCLAHRSVYFVVREALDGVPEADCNALVSAYVIGQQKWEAGRRWWMHGSFSSFQILRRGDSAPLSRHLAAGASRLVYGGMVKQFLFRWRRASPTTWHSTFRKPDTMRICLVACLESPVACPWARVVAAFVWQGSLGTKIPSQHVLQAAALRRELGRYLAGSAERTLYSERQWSCVAS